MNFQFIFFLAGLFAVNISSLFAEWNEKEFDQFIEEAMAEFKVPGAAITIVKGNDILLQQGYGFRNVLEKLPVTKDTLFPIGSITKSITAATLATLVDEGRVQWDSQVRDYLPGIRFSQDKYAELTLLDMLVHRSGMPRHDSVWHDFSPTHEELMSQIRYLEMSKPLRTTFQYNNILYSLAGDVISAVDKKSYDESVRERILNPLEMHSTNFSIVDSLFTEDYASAYSKDPSTREVVNIGFHNLDNVTAAGGINTTATDAARYLSFLLNAGIFENHRIVSEASMSSMCTPHILFNPNPPFKETEASYYGLGLIISKYRGKTLISHTGGIDGFSAVMLLLPEEQIGIFIMSNLDEEGANFGSAVGLKAIDRLLNFSPIPWVQRYITLEHNAYEEQSRKLMLDAKQQIIETKPSHDLLSYTGSYKNDGYGELNIYLEDNQLSLFIGKKKRQLKHFHYDVFMIESDLHDGLNNKKLNFSTDFKGKIESVAIPLEASVKPIVFYRSI